MKIRVLDGDKYFTSHDVRQLLPVVISDLKHVGKPVTDENIKAALFHCAVLKMYDKAAYGVQEPEYDERGTFVVQEHCYIKGYVRDVWEYLEIAYKAVHNNKF